MRTTRRIAVTTAIVCAIPAVWSSTAAAVPIGLYDTAPVSTSQTWLITESQPQRRLAVTWRIRDWG
jgi:hypothetical protein